MLEWDSRIQNKQSVQILKAVIPFFDVAVGESIDMEGLLGAVRPFTGGRERRMVDMLLQFFQMRRMMEMVQLVQSMQQLSAMSEGADSMGEEVNSMEKDSVPWEEKGEEQHGNSGSSGMMDMLRSMVPPEQQSNLEMMTAMMSMMAPGQNGEEQAMEKA